MKNKLIEKLSNDGLYAFYILFMNAHKHFLKLKSILLKSYMDLVMTSNGWKVNKSSNEIPKYDDFLILACIICYASIMILMNINEQ